MTTETRQDVTALKGDLAATPLGQVARFIRERLPAEAEVARSMFAIGIEVAVLAPEWAIAARADYNRVMEAFWGVSAEDAQLERQADVRIALAGFPVQHITEREAGA